MVLGSISEAPSCKRSANQLPFHSTFNFLQALYNHRSMLSRFIIQLPAQPQ